MGEPGPISPYTSEQERKIELYNKKAKYYKNVPLYAYTIEHHKEIGSTPPDFLQPGKTDFESRTIESILSGQEFVAKTLRQRLEDKRAGRGNNQTLVWSSEGYLHNIPYLRDLIRDGKVRASEQKIEQLQENLDTISNLYTELGYTVPETYETRTFEEALGNQ
jgi:hypothetical protein